MSNDNNVARRPITAPVVQRHGPSLAKVLSVGAGSTIVNGTVVGLLLGVSWLMGGKISAEELAKVNAPSTQKETVLEESPRELDLTNKDEGLDDTVQLNYNNDNIQEVSVPGPVDVTQAVGIQGAPEAPPTNVPPPAGAGGGTGGAVIDPNAIGGGQAFGTLGGMGGPGGGGFAGRSGSTRKKMLNEGGGNAASEAAVARGLEWIALHQAADGHWGLHDFNKHAREKVGGKFVPGGDNSTPNTTRRNDTAGTAFGLLPFLAAGITHKSSAKKNEQVDYSKVVNAGLMWLMAKQSKASNDRGYFGGDMYSHGLATIAMCEAYGLTSDPRLKASAQMAIDYIERAQHEGGGWRYAPGQAGDTSVVGWQLMGLKSGQMAGLTVKRQTLQKVTRYLDSAEGSDKGSYGYTPGTGGSQAMTAVGALCRQYLGTNPLNPSLLASVKKLKAVPPSQGGNGHSIYYEYYATQVLHHMGGEHWDEWNLGKDGKNGIRDTLIRRQAKDGANAGSFEGNDHGSGGRLGATSLSLLTLEVYYRHLPLYRREAGADKPEDK